MNASEVLARERAELCDDLERLGAEAPTLCAGWDATDLAAHLVVREHDPRSLPGLVIPGPPARLTERLRRRARDQGFARLVDRLRAGPPWAFRTGPAAGVNVNENWIHHEDLRRAGGEAPRASDADLDAVLWRALGLGGRVAARRVRDVPLRVVTPDGRVRAFSRRRPTVTLRGDPGELVLYLAGRKDAARVELEGPDAAVAAVRAARFGV